MISLDDLQPRGDYYDDRYAQPPAPPPPPWATPAPPPWDPYAGDYNHIVPPTSNTNPPIIRGGGDAGGGGGGMSEAEGRAHDAANGLVGGYMTANGWVSGSPSSGGGGGGGGFNGLQPPARPQPPALNYPGFNAPTFNAPAPFSYDPFAYENFTAPTIEEAQKEPGFEYALGQGIKAMENSKAYLGTYRTGGTIKGLNDYARNMANQNYNQVFERKGQTYDRNRGNAFGNYSANRANAADAYTTNYGISRDVFDRKYTAAKDTYAPQARATELQFARDWDQYTYEGDDAYRRMKAILDANS